MDKARNTFSSDVSVLAEPSSVTVSLSALGGGGGGVSFRTFMSRLMRLACGGYEQPFRVSSRRKRSDHAPAEKKVRQSWQQRDIMMRWP